MSDARERLRPLVLVEWMDAYSESGWRPLDELEHGEPLHCRSVGWLLGKKGGHVILAPHISGEKNGNIRLFGNGHMTIPLRMVTKLRKLKERP